MKKIYLDHAASTPVDPRVLRAMAPYWSREYGNAGALHSFGQGALRAVDNAREAILSLLGDGPEDFRNLIFTGSATEANNLALRGVFTPFLHAWKLFPKSPRLILSPLEHESVLETARDLEERGVDVVFLPVDRSGVVNVKALDSLLDDRTLLVSVMSVNNEIGAVQPIAEISRVICNWKLETGKVEGQSPITNYRYPLFHSDAVQAFAYYDCKPSTLGADLITFSAHKINGPKGVGALYIKSEKLKVKSKKSENDFITPIITGGGQEFGLRSGTENVPGIVGFRESAFLADSLRKKEAKRLLTLKRFFLSGLKKVRRGTVENGPKVTASYSRVSPHILNVHIPNIPSEDFLIALDRAGVAASAASACSARAQRDSYVLSAIGLEKKRTQGSIRFSFGRTTTRDELAEALRRIRKVLEKI